MSPRKLPRLIRTVSGLRCSQLLWRSVYMLGRRLPAPNVALSSRGGPAAIGSRPFPAVPLFHRAGPGGDALVSELARGCFTHLNRSVSVGRERPEWRLGPQRSNRLWIVTLHYHGWAYALAEVAARNGPESDLAAELLEHYVGDWIDRCDLDVPGARDLAWNSFAAATRMGWWIRSYQLLQESSRRLTPAFERRLVESLWRQASFLHAHLEWDLRGNHLLRDLVGLAWAGRFLDGPEARSWLRTATEVTRDQLREQILPDGAHFERSPMYHIHAMEDVLSLALLLDDVRTVTMLTETWRRMAAYLAWLLHAGGRIPLLNDGAWRAVCDPDRMLELAGTIGASIEGAPPVGGRVFDDVGLCVWRGKVWSVFFDTGPLGPPAVPGHGHADNLTFECAYRGRRLFVDPGSFAYDNDDRRRHDRSTAAHNTVGLDGTDSSEVWHIFRVGRRARTLDVRTSFRERSFEVSAEHDGYRHLDGRPIHRRTLAADEDGWLTVVDSIRGGGRHRLQGGLLVDPDWTIEPAEGGWNLASNGLRLGVRTRGPQGLKLTIEPARFHPEYGVEIPARRLRWDLEGELPLEVRTEIRESSR